MMEISGDKPERWGLFDDEKYDKKVEYMVGLIKDGHVFSKAHWGGGDAADPLYVYSEKENTKKRKGFVVKGDEPLLKQRRMSAYFQRGVSVDVEKFEKVVGKVEELAKEVEMLRGRCDKQEKIISKLKNLKKFRSSGNCRSGTKKLLSVRDGTRVRRSRRSAVGGSDVRHQLPDSVEGTPSGSLEEKRGEDGASLLVMMKRGVSDAEAQGENIGEGLGLSSTELGELGVLVRAVVSEPVVDGLEDGKVLTVKGPDNDPETGDTLEERCVVDVEPPLKAVEESLVGDGDEMIGPLKCENEEPSVEKTVEEVEAPASSVGCEPPVKGSEVVTEEQTAEEVDSSVIGEGVECSGAGSEELNEPITGNGESVTAVSAEIGDVSDNEGGDEDLAEEAEDGGVEVNSPERVVYEDVSDSSTPRTEVHKPVEEEEQLAAVLLAKDQIAVPEVVPMLKDSDYPFFERVLKANPEV
ncbi:unnamed protein product [Eruca vesicaria subsp. sativa]|uniref:Uncharacterized protein n=1 Tax=Eruca vesicaria subsp. sativa TaxID=29727 RepID=A0ABC8KZY3_ERUVS|nr:unnamed protein product [Eruca vesicaria subsp. sativa]